jgi:CBS domain-containing protein
VLRSLLTVVRGRVSATRTAVLVANVLAGLLLIAGIWAGDYLMPLVSLFIVVAAQMELRNVEMEASLRALPVGQFALWEAGGIRPDEPLAHAVGDGPKDMVVTSGGRVIGMLWLSDLMRHLNGAHHELTVQDIMDRGTIAVEATDSVYDVHEWLIVSGRSAVAVVEDGRYRGIFTIDRLAHVHHLINSRSLRRRPLLYAFISRLRPGWR